MLAATRYERRRSLELLARWRRWRKAKMMRRLARRSPRRPTSKSSIG